VFSVFSRVQGQFSEHGVSINVYAGQKQKRVQVFRFTKSNELKGLVPLPGAHAKEAKCVYGFRFCKSAHV